MKKLICFILAALTVLPFAVSCGETANAPEDTGAVTTTDTVTTAPAPEEVPAPVLIKDGAVLYGLIRETDLPDAQLAEVTKIFDKLKVRSSSPIVYKDDVVARGVDPNNGDPEILVGKTNRRESLEVFETLGAYDWTVRVVGVKIVVIGGCAEATGNAIKWFLSNVLPGTSNDDGTVTLDALTSPHNVTLEYAASGLMICGTPFADFTVGYSTVGEEDARTAATSFVNSLAHSTGKILSTASAPKTETVKNEILIGKTQRARSAELTSQIADTMAYQIVAEGGKLYIVGGSGWAISCAVGTFSELVSKGLTDVPEGYRLSGSASGRQSIPLDPGSDLRLMTNNVWACDANAAAWKAIGEDCSAKTRAIGFADVYLAYMPDVVNFQEMTPLMVSEILKDMKKYGVEYKLLTFSATSTDNTCLIYNPETVELLDSGHHLYSYGNNSNSKGYTWGYFKLKSSGKCFVSLSTHLWWKSESAEPGSNEYRRRQAEEVVAVSKELVGKYNCPVFVQGDLNTTTQTDAFKELIDGGFENNYSIASVKADTRRGYHSCNSDGFSTELSGGTYISNSIDHMLVLNRGETDVRVFDHIIVDFYFKLSDHFPVYSDIKLN